MKNSKISFSNKSIKLILLTGLLLSIILGIVSSNYLANQVANKVQNSFIDFIFDSVYSGPLTFAKLHSSAIANEQLKTLMETSALKERGIFSVQIASAGDSPFIFALWESKFFDKVDSSCIHQETREYDFPDALNSFKVILNYNSCIKLPENSYISKISLFIILGMMLVVSSFILLSFSPIVSSIYKAEKTLIGLKTNLSNDIVFIPIKNLVVEALKAKNAEFARLLHYQAQQVAHDIRSPLSSLNMITSGIANLPEEQRTLINQAIAKINAIANDLLTEKIKFKNSSLPDEPKQDLSTNLTLRNNDILNMTKTVLSEKKLEYKKDDRINFYLEEVNIRDIKINFVKVNFERILSNILNNSAESLSGGKGDVMVSMYTETDCLCIKVSDNGKGIPKEVLSKIGQKGFSYGKEHLVQSGSGLGLYHAKKTMQEFGGELLIDSELGKGTTVTLKIPLADQH